MLKLTISPLQALILSVFVIVMLAPRLIRWKLMSLPLLVVFLHSPRQLGNSGEFEVSVLDVGQGLALHIKTQNHDLIYDLGPEYESGFNTAQAVVLPYLKNQGVKTVNKVIFSHEDKDHIGGRKHFVELYPDAEKLSVVNQDGFVACIKPHSWQWDGVNFEVLSPYNLKPYLHNNSSCVLKISSAYGSILVTGDIEDPIEYRLIQQSAKAIQADVLLVPHHGSRTSSGVNFIKTVNPKIAVNSSGFNNQFRHPHPKVKGRYENLGIEFFDTQQSGMIRLLFQKQGIQTLEYKKQNRKLWYVE